MASVPKGNEILGTHNLALVLSTERPGVALVLPAERPCAPPRASDLPYVGRVSEIVRIVNYIVSE
ncbi:MAG: hypothetical protein VXV91_06250, partial [Verrucomicrobiota bacterium]|nr:hypothetical protein [Verrucomicrobiota bacterium]